MIKLIDKYHLLIQVLKIKSKCVEEIKLLETININKMIQ